LFYLNFRETLFGEETIFVPIIGENRLISILADIEEFNTNFMVYCKPVQ